MGLARTNASHLVRRRPPRRSLKTGPRGFSAPSEPSTVGAYFCAAIFTLTTCPSRRVRLGTQKTVGARSAASRRNAPWTSRWARSSCASPRKTLQWRAAHCGRSPTGAARPQPRRVATSYNVTMLHLRVKPGTERGFDHRHARRVRVVVVAAFQPARATASIDIRAHAKMGPPRASATGCHGLPLLSCDVGLPRDWPHPRRNKLPRWNA